MDVNRKKARGDQEIIEISDLPNNVIDNILDCLPLGDAVRTSILSRKWWHHWTRIGNLVFNGRFLYTEIVREIEHRDEETLRSIYNEAIGTVLLLHSGPIHKFDLYVPLFCDGPAINAQISKWLNYVSRNGVKDLKVEFSTNLLHRSVPKPLPSHIFHCQELKRLSLQNCIFDLPCYFTGFSNLISLHLSLFYADDDGLNVFISSCPILENLCLKFYSGPLSVSVLGLKTLEILSCKLAGFTMQNFPNLVTASIRESSILSVQPQRIETFFDPIPNIESITLDSYFFEDMDQHHIPKTLPTPLKCVKNLAFDSFYIANRAATLFSLCILRSLPYLQTLSVVFLMPLCNRDEDLAPTVAFCEEQFSKPFNLRSIVIVKIEDLAATRAQIAFIKFILASSPALEVLYVNAAWFMSDACSFRIMTEINDYRRASSKAKIIYKHPEY